MVSGCAAERIQLPNFEEAERSSEEVTDPTEYPTLCMVPWTASDCWQALDIFEDIADNNLELAQLNADIARDGDAAYDYILSAAKKQQEISQIRQEMLEAERRARFFDKVQYGVIVIVLTIGLIL